MILLRKKRILFILSILSISIFTYFFSTSNLKSTIETVSLPVSNKVIILDGGHGRRRCTVQNP